MPIITDPVGYWDHYAGGITHETPEEALKNAFGWTQYEGHGPGDELLGEPLTTLELGSGRGNAVAALATKGIDATGIDISPAQVKDAQDRWGKLPGARYLQGDVFQFLVGADEQWDAIYSIWGALWFTDPELLLPAVHDRLTPGGKLCSPMPRLYRAATASRACTATASTAARCGSTAGPTNPAPGPNLLHEHGFVDIHARIEPALQPDNVGTLFVEARR